MKFPLRCIALAVCFIAGMIPVRSQTVTEGAIILRGGNSVPGRLIKLNKKREEESMAYTQLQVMDSAGGVRTYLPADLLGYVKDGVAYKSFNDNGYAFFARCLVEGPSTLFFHPGYGVGDERAGSRYFFKKPGESGFVMMNSISPFPKTIGVAEPRSGDGSNRTQSLMLLKKKDTVFIDFFTEYFKDCQGLVRKIKMEFYTIADMKSVFEEFNTCGAPR